MSQPKALVVLSGGQDSSTCLFWAVDRYGSDNVHAVTFDYDQRHRVELAAAVNVAKLAGVAHHEIVLVGSILAGSSPLTNKDAVLERYDSYEEMDKVIGDRVEKTFVPMRNALFLTLAANRAAVLGTRTIITILTARRTLSSHRNVRSITRLACRRMVRWAECRLRHR
jgi:7-cyano-7-deazaguanine synthase